MKSVELSVKERLELPSVLPERGGFIQQEIIASIKDKIRFSPKEIEELQMKDLPDGRILWNSEKAAMVNYEFEDSFVDVMKKGVDNLDKAEAIPTSLFPLCKKIRSIE
jgi:hypothetical protein